MNPWHAITTGSNAPKIVNAVIEIPRGSKGKFELHKDTGIIRLDRVLFSAVHYPANYGFIPQTFCEDGDPLDILVITSIDLPILCLVECRVIGVMRMHDSNKADDKIIAVGLHDIGFSQVKQMADLPRHTLREIERFFEDYKKLENKTVVVERFQGQHTAHKIIRESVQLYRKKYGNQKGGGVA